MLTGWHNQQWTILTLCIYKGVLTKGITLELARGGVPGVSSCSDDMAVVQNIRMWWEGSLDHMALCEVVRVRGAHGTPGMHCTLHTEVGVSLWCMECH